MGALIFLIMIGAIVAVVAWDRRIAKSGFYRQRSARGVKEEV